MAITHYSLGSAMHEFYPHGRFWNGPLRGQPCPPPANKAGADNVASGTQAATSGSAQASNQAAGSASSGSSSFKDFMVQQLASLKHELRREIVTGFYDEMKAANQQKNTAMQNALTDLGKLERSFLDGMGKAVESHAGALLGELAGRLEANIGADSDRISKLLNALSSTTSAASQGNDNGEPPLREVCKDIVALVKQVEGTAKKLEARWDKLDASAAARPSLNAHQGSPSTRASPTTDQSNEDDAAPTHVMDQQEKIALVQAAIAAATGLGGQASLNITVTASSVSLAVTKGGGASSPPTTATATPTASSAHQTESSGARDSSSMPPAKRPRTDEVATESGKEGSQGSSASETLTGEDDSDASH